MFRPTGCMGPVSVLFLSVLYYILVSVQPLCIISFCIPLFLYFVRVICLPNEYLALGASGKPYLALLVLYQLFLSLVACRGWRQALWSGKPFGPVLLIYYHYFMFSLFPPLESTCLRKSRALKAGRVLAVVWASLFSSARLHRRARQRL